MGRKQISARTAAFLLLLPSVAALACRFVNPDHASAAALKTLTATLAVAAVPGMLITLLCWPRAQLSILELAGFGVAVTFAMVHVLTMAAIVLHVSPVAVLWAIGVLCAAVALRLVWRPPVPVTIHIDEVIIAALLAVLALALYLQGSPVGAYEDQVLVAVMRRLSALNVPRIDNFYVAPGVTYTYPFPGLLYLMALVTRVADVDALFVYHKLRFFWGPAALVMLYLVARAVFGQRAIACAVAVTAIVFIASGAFAAVAGFPAWWGQLVPYSYVPDVAMTVLLPALLAAAFAYLCAETARERRFFLATTAGLVLMLTAVHVREIIQFAAYLGCFAVVAAMWRRWRLYLRPTLALLALTLSIAAIYSTWQGSIVPVVHDIVDRERSELASVAGALPLRAMMLEPAPAVLGDFIQDFDQMFAGLLPFLLFAGPAVVVLFRDRPLVWLLASSIIAYLAVMIVPALAAAYIYATYFEILQIPVRNIIFFLYLFAGALVYVAVVLLSQLDRTRLSLPVAGAAGGLLALLTMICLSHGYWAFFVPAIAAYGFAFLFAAERSERDSFRGLIRSPRVILAIVAALGAMAILWPDHAPPPRSEQVTIRWSPALSDDERQQLEQRFSLAAGARKTDAAESNVWNYRLSDLSRDNVRAIVMHPGVADTHFIDRSAFTVESQPPPGDDLPLAVRFVRWLQYPGTAWLILTAVFTAALGFILPAVAGSLGGVRVVLESAAEIPFYRRAVPFVLFIIPFALWSTRPTLSPFALTPMPPAGRADTPQALITQIPCATLPAMPARFAEEAIVLPNRTVCPPDSALLDWVHTHIPVEAVFAVNRWTPFPPQMFMPQQADVFPTLDASFIAEDALFPDYYAQFTQRIRRYGVQPFFNTSETAEERAAFVTALDVTHVLVDPEYYDQLRPVLDALPDRFALKYDAAKWAVYEVIRR